MRERWLKILYHKFRNYTRLKNTFLKSKSRNEIFFLYRIEIKHFQTHNLKHQFFSQFWDLNRNDEKWYLRWKFSSKHRKRFDISKIIRKKCFFILIESMRRLICYSRKWIFYKNSRILKNFERFLHWRDWVNWW